MNTNLPYWLTETIAVDSVLSLFENSLKWSALKSEELEEVINYYNTNEAFRNIVIQIYSAVTKNNIEDWEARKSDLDLTFLIAALEKDIDWTIREIQAWRSMFHVVTIVDKILYEEAENK